MGSSDRDHEPPREIARSFCLLLVEAAGVGEDPAGSIGPPAPVVIPPGRSYLVMPADDPPRIASRPGPDDRRWCALEPIRREHAFQLLVAAAPGASFQVNGVPAPPLMVFEERDVITFDEGQVSFHLSTYVRPYIGPALAEHEGRSCSFCQTPLSTGRDVYVCPFCDAPAHLDTGEGREASPRLECAARMQSCSQCLNPVLTVEGLTYVPEEALGA